MDSDPDATREMLERKLAAVQRQLQALNLDEEDFVELERPEKIKKRKHYEHEAYMVLDRAFHRALEKHWDECMDDYSITSPSEMIANSREEFLALISLRRQKEKVRKEKRIKQARQAKKRFGTLERKK